MSTPDAAATTPVAPGSPADAPPDTPWAAVRRAFRRDIRLQFGAVIMLVMILVALLAPLLAPHNPTETSLRSRLATPGAEHWLGTDRYGRDVASRLIYGTRVSLAVGVLVVAASAFLGFAIGTIAGYFGGMVDTVIMRLVDVMLAFPGFLLALALVATMGSNLGTVIIAISIA
ncbi:MAG: ABC transporter permease, partial [Gammaproteobacteria bacterium]|nr:ABC transporter permease [Gammaproteobacteria bacterium]